MRSSIVSLVAIIVLGLSFAARTAEADCNCVAIAGDVDASVQAQIAKADGLYARGDFNGALAIYADAYASSRASVLLYAQGMANVMLGAQAKAREQFKAYLAAGGSLAYKAKAEAQLSLLGGATSAVGVGVGKVGGVVGGVGGDVVGGVGGAVNGERPDVGGAAAGGVGAVGGVAAGVKGNVEGKVKVGKKAGIILGVIAIAALGAVAIHGIAAGVSDDISLDAKFDLGMGIAGVSVGISAIYVAGLTAATTAAAGAPCLTEMQTRNARPVGLAAGFRF